MYLEHFGLQTDPFKLDPNLDFVFLSTGHKEAIAHLVYGIEQGDSFVLLTGGIGTGKTLALHFMLDQVISSFKTSFVNVTQIGFLELLKLILDGLEVPFDRNGDKADLIQSFKSFLITTRKNRERVLVVVDEAQELSVKTLEALRLLSNLTQPGEQILQIVIAGQPGLAKMIASPELEQLRQRIRVRYDLETLSGAEIGPYIEHRLAVAGRKESLFTKGALKRIFELSHGIPRLVNLQADNALLAAYVDDSSKVNANHVEDEMEITPTFDGGAKPTSQVTAPPMKEKAWDDNRNATSGRKSSPVLKESKRRMVALWIIFPTFLLLGAWYTYTQTTLLNGFFEKDSMPQQQQSLVDPHPNLIQELPAKELAHQTTSIPEPDTIQVLIADSPAKEVVLDKAVTDPGQPSAVAIPASQFAIHVASFQSMDRAQRQLSEFQKDGMGAFIKNAVVDEKDWSRLFIGPFDSEEIAGIKGQDLKSTGIIEYYIVTTLTQN